MLLTLLSSSNYLPKRWHSTCTSRFSRMTAIVQFVLKHGYTILFAAIFVHQIGLPVPGPLFLLAGGALAATGDLSLITCVVLAVFACVLADWPWYEAGRRRGDSVLHFIHRITRNPDYHDRRAKETFARYGPSILLISKFVPGLDAVAPPLAGTARTSRIRFLFFDGAGAALYSCVYAGMGFIFCHDLNRAAAYLSRAGGVLAAIVLFLIALYVVPQLAKRFHHKALSSDSAKDTAKQVESAQPQMQDDRTIGVRNGD